jgi:hypothetical protein
MKKIISLLLALSLLFSPCAFAKDLYQVQKPPVGSQIDWGHPLSNGLVACFLMNEGGGNKVSNLQDGSKGTFNGTKMIWKDNGIYVPTGGNYNDGIIFKNRGAIDNNFTQATWVFLYNCIDAGSSNYGYIYDRADGFDIRHLSDANHLTSDINYSVTPLRVATTTILNTWVTYAMVFTSLPIGKIQWYKNGIKAESGTNSFTFQSLNTGNIGIAGQSTGGTRSIHGGLKYLYLYSRALSSSEIQQLYIDPYCFIKQNYRMYAPAQAITPQLAWPTTRLIYD